MADSKELGIIVTGDTQDALEKLSGLTDAINNIADKTVDLTINVVDTGINTVVDEISQINNETISPNVDSAPLQDLSTNASMAATEIMDASNSAADLGASISTIDSQAINEAASAASALGNDLSQASNEASNMSSNMSTAGTDIANTTTSISALSGSIAGVGGEINSAFNSISKFADGMGIAASQAELLAVALAAVTAVAIAAFLADATAKAGEFNDSWSRLGEAIDQGGQSIQQVQGEWSDAVNSMKESTGRSAGIIRDHIISMGLAGIDSKELIIDAFEGISGEAFVTGQSIDTIEQAYRRAVSTGILGSRQLMQLGITTDDVYKATGLTMDQVRDKFKSLDTEGRAALLNLIINQKYGETANQAYINSWQHVGDAITAAMNYLSIVVGQLILPIVIPAVNFLTFTLNTLAGGIKSLTDFFGFLNGVIGNSSVIFGALTLLLGPLGLILAPIGAAVGFIADNWGRLTKDVDDFFTLIKAGKWDEAFTLLVNEMKWAFVDAPIAYISSLPGKVGELASQFLDVGKNIINWIVTGLTSLEDWLDEQLKAEFSNAGESAGESTISGFEEWLDDNGWKIAEIISDVLTQILPKIISIVIKIIQLILKAAFDELSKWASDLPGNMYTWGQNAFNSFVNGIIDGIPGLKNALNLVKQLFPQSPPKEGPLADITEEGMSSWMGDIVNAGMNVISDFDLSNLVLPSPNPSSYVTNSSNKSEVNLYVDLGSANISSDLDAEKVGRTVGKSAAEEMASGALNAGISVVNYQRS